MNEHPLPRVAIVGYPNVGKSTLFNRLVGGREAVVAPEAGVTRDRKMGSTEWNGRRFEVIDTGGLDLVANEPLAEEVRNQARRALSEADVVVFLVDGTGGVRPQDHEIAEILRRSRVPVHLVVNKADTDAARENVPEFWALGLGQPLAVSAEHGTGTGDLLDLIVSGLPPAVPGEAREPPVRIAIVGRPNVGKSSLLNALLGDDRVVVSPVPGTTRDAIDTFLEFEGRTIQLIDTAGLRRRSRRASTNVEYFSSLRSMRALERSDVALVVVDSAEGLVDLDLQVAYEAQRNHCATAVLFAKWDITRTDVDLATARLKQKVQMRPPWLTVSTVTGRNLDRILPVTIDLHALYRGRIPTADLNKWLEEMKGRGNPPRRGGKSLKIFYAVQYDDSPPRFKFMVNSRGLITRNYAYFLENQLRSAYDLHGIPLIIDFEGKEERYG